MKKLAMLLPLVIIGILVHGQSGNHEIVYNGDAVYMILLNLDGSLATKKTVGKNPGIYHDTFFDSYTLVYKNEDGLVEVHKFSYVNTGPDGKKRYSTHDSIHTIDDRLAEKGYICFLSEEIVSGEYYGAMVIEKAKRGE